MVELINCYNDIIGNEVMQKILALSDMEIYVSLGCSEEERAYKQKISLDLELKFDQSFEADCNDKLVSTVCYYSLRNYIQNFCDSIECNLIEYLGTEIYNYINNRYPTLYVKYLKITKRPPVAQIGAASYIIKS